MEQMAQPISQRHLYVLLIGLGIAVWLLPWLLLGRKEAWDHASYFSISIPLMSVLAGYASYRAKTRAWRWPLTLIVAQIVTGTLARRIRKSLSAWTCGLRGVCNTDDDCRAGGCLARTP